MKRRNVLQLAAGAAATAALPLAHRLARADEGTAPRFLFVVEGNGFEPASVLCDSAREALDGSMAAPFARSRWAPDRYRHDVPLEVAAPDLAVSSYLSTNYGTAFPLEPLAEHGVVADATVLLGLSSRIVGGGHSGLYGALSSARSNGGRPGGQTIDAYLASLPSVRGTTPFDAFRVGVGNGSTIDFRTCAFGRGRPAPLIRDVSAAYQFAYGAFTSGASRQAFDRQARMLAFAEGDVAASSGVFTGNEREIEKLDSYQRAIAELRQAQSRLEAMDITAPTAPGTELSALERFDTMMDLATSVLIDGLAPVAVVGSGTGGDFSLRYSEISETGRHDMQHGSGRSPELLDAVRQVNRRQVGAIARAARRLKDAGMLDRTVIVWVGDNGEQHHSTSSEFAVLMLGGTAVGLQPGGRTVIYPGVRNSQNRQLSNLWNTLGYVAGQSLDEFGAEVGSLRRAPGPLGELLV